MAQLGVALWHVGFGPVGRGWRVKVLWQGVVDLVGGVWGVVFGCMSLVCGVVCVGVGWGVRVELGWGECWGVWVGWWHRVGVALGWACARHCQVGVGWVGVVW